MNQPTPGIDTTPQTEMISVSQPDQAKSRIMKVVYPDLTESTQNHVEMVVESPSIGTEQTLPLIQTTERPTKLQIQVLRLITVQILPILLACLLTKEYITDEFIVVQKHGPQYQVKWPFKLAIVINCCFLWVIPMSRTKLFIIRYQKYIYMLQNILLIPLFIGIWRWLYIIGQVDTFCILIITGYCIQLQQRMCILLKKPQLTMNFVKYLIYLTFGINCILVLFGVDMQKTILIESLTIYLLYYFIQLNESLTTENNFNPLLRTLIQSLMRSYTSNEPVQTEVRRFFIIIKNILAFIGLFVLFELVHQLTDFPICAFVIWAILANTQIVNATAKLRPDDQYLAALMFYADLINFLPNIIRSISKSD